MSEKTDINDALARANGLAGQGTEFYIESRNGKFFLNLCGHYSLVKHAEDATLWDDENHKEMWFYLHELKASTNQTWFVVSNTGIILAEPEEARKVIITLAKTIENYEKEVVLEPLTFNEAFQGRKFIPQRVWYYTLLIKGTTKYIPVAEVEGKFYRYKSAIRDMNNTYREDMWLW